MNNMLWAGESMISLGRCRTPEEVTERVEKVTAEDLRRVAANLFNRPGMDLAVVGPVPPARGKELSDLLSR